jgi:hypothetical protein
MSPRISLSTLSYLPLFHAVSDVTFPKFTLFCLEIQDESLGQGGELVRNGLLLW